MDDAVRETLDGVLQTIKSMADCLAAGDTIKTAIGLGGIMVAVSLLLQEHRKKDDNPVDG